MATVDSRLCTPAGHLVGGAALAACLVALERFTERPAAWATAQYLAYADAGDTLDIDVRVAATGRRITQVRAVGHVDDREILTVNAALGGDPTDTAGYWTGRPDVPCPDQCRALDLPWPGQTMLGGYDTRIAVGRNIAELQGSPGDGRSALWVGLDAGEEISVAALAMLGDGLSFGLSQLVGRPVKGRSLDNTFRIGRLVPTRWVLLDIYAYAVDQGLGHGAMHLWADDGTLLATASQSCVVRPLNR